MLLSRHLNFDRHSPGHNQQHDSLLLTLTETMDSTSDLSGRAIKGSWIRESTVLRLGLLVWTLFGASCVMADGLLTPAVSVISAVGGISCPVISDMRYRNSCPIAQQCHRSDLHRRHRGSGTSHKHFTHIVLDPAVWNALYIPPVRSHRRSLVSWPSHHRRNQHCNKRSRYLSRLQPRRSNSLSYAHP